VRLAIGSGGWNGQGFMEGRQTQGGFIPYQLNDFIFSVAGEELGFIGAAGLLVLLSFIVIRVFVVAGRSGDAFGRFVGVGVGTWLAFQVFQNVGMNLGVMPVTGLPLPFVSYGGSSMFASWLAIGVVNAAYAAGHRNRV
jgi:rod shape determining protein RodA